MRLAIRLAIDVALDRLTRHAYEVQPLPRGVTPGDLVGWDDANALARPAVKRKNNKKTSPRKRAA